MTSLPHTHIPLDPGVRDWVFFPLIFVLFLFAFLRHFAAVLLRNPPKVDAKQIADSLPLVHAQFMSQNGFILTPDAFRTRYENLTQYSLLRDVENNQMSAMMDPSMMTNLMKQNVTGILPNIAMMSFVSYFFSGLIIARFPFQLSERFREMLQRGVELTTLDVSYVTSLSMYFLMFFGQRGIVALVLGEASEADDAKLIQSQSTGAPPPGMAAAAVDLKKMYKQAIEETHLAKAQYVCRLDATENRFIDS